MFSARRGVPLLAVPIALVAIVLTVQSTAWAKVTVVFSDTFDSETQGQGVTALTNWTVTGNVDVVGAGSGVYDGYPGNGTYIDLDGSNTGTTSCASSTIQSPAIALGPGNYTLSFEFGSNTFGGGQDNGLQVQLGSVFSETFFPSPVDSKQATAQLDLTRIARRIKVGAATSASLVFQETDATADCGGTILDDVLLVRRGP